MARLPTTENVAFPRGSCNGRPPPLHSSDSVNPCVAFGHVSVPDPSFNSVCLSEEPDFFQMAGRPLVHQITPCSPDGFVPRCPTREGEEWRLFRTKRDELNGKVCKKETHAYYCILTQPKKDDLLACCLDRVPSSERPRKCGTAYVPGNGTCSAPGGEVDKYCRTGNNIVSQECQAYCSGVEGGWCSEALETYCNDGENLVNDPVCKRVCPTDDIESRASWCDRSATAYCSVNSTADYCSCFNPDETLPPVCFNSTCTSSGYKIGSDLVLQNCSAFCEQASECIINGTCEINEEQYLRHCPLPYPTKRGSAIVIVSIILMMFLLLVGISLGIIYYLRSKRK